MKILCKWSILLLMEIDYAYLRNLYRILFLGVYIFSYMHIDSWLWTIVLFHCRLGSKYDLDESEIAVAVGYIKEHGKQR